MIPVLAADPPNNRPSATLFSLRTLDGARAGAGAALRVGCVVRTGRNLHPQFEVVALSGAKAWVREVQSGSDHVVPIERCRPVKPSDWQGPCHVRPWAHRL